MWFIGVEVNIRRVLRIYVKRRQNDRLALTFRALTPLFV